MTSAKSKSARLVATAHYEAGHAVLAITVAAEQRKRSRG